jgi:hypothetical protein
LDVKELKNMSGLIKKAVPAALLAALGVALNANGASINLSGGQSTILGGWQIGTDPNVSVTGISVSGQTLIIQNESATFTNGIPQGLTFIQISSAVPVPFIQISTNTVSNASGSNWTGFQYTLSGSASFDGITNVFTPPFGTGVNYLNLDLSPSRNLLTYTGSQLGGSTSNWGSNNPGDDLLIDGNPSTGAPFASFTLDESPQGVVSEVVPVAPAAWQFLVGLMAVGAVPMLRKAMRFFA